MAEKNHNEMTLDECREELGRLPHLSVQGNPPRISNTLDAIAGAMPGGWRFVQLTVYNDGHYATAIPQPEVPRKSFPQQATADTEILARGRLAVACWRATKGEQR